MVEFPAARCDTKMIMAWAFVILMPVLHAVEAVTPDVSPSDSFFVYEGRWAVTDGFHHADWPCSGFRFQVLASTENCSLELLWYGRYTRINITVSDAQSGGHDSRIASGPAFAIVKDVSREKIVFPHIGKYEVSVRKLTSAEPFGTGIGSWFLHSSILEFHGIASVKGATLSAPLRRSTFVQFVGASDTAGYCVDGTPSLGTPALTGWKYENCDAAYSGQLGYRLGAEISVQAIAGIGITQNAQASQSWKLGSVTMPGYFTRTLQTSAQSAQSSPFNKPWPDLVVISLGGNGFAKHCGWF
eukprot:gnl/TRDRNA2_/TRDRNA2_127689_c0_seq2.p1 gnl/TRDRNA2_/TRDRNA2_127689_c0~~gnl/TRDRNA2_/TRDRNA2_127689_c0_seq2.p1  ORF type:complete len:300 (+),score=16.59 gnl/TRDRNA2_/TRDRNA2_127689_c0_seq2:3-902(+)